MQYKAFIGIGSNLGTPAENCEKAIRLLHAPPEIEVVARSSLYESEPVGKIEQNWFVNATVAINTSLAPEVLLKNLLKIEKDLGREQARINGPILPRNYPVGHFISIR